MSATPNTSLPETCSVHGGEVHPFAAHEVWEHWEWIEPLHVEKFSPSDCNEHCDFCHRHRPAAAELYHRPKICSCFRDPCGEQDISLICVDCWPAAVLRFGYPGGVIPADTGTDDTTYWVMPAVTVPRDCLEILARDALEELKRDAAAGQRVAVPWAIATAFEALGYDVNAFTYSLPDE
jgi:hypothetical protein